MVSSESPILFSSRRFSASNGSETDAFGGHDPGYGRDEETVYGGAIEDLGYVHPCAQRVEDGEDAVRAGFVEATVHVLGVDLERSHSLHQALRERPPYRHDLANGVHPGGQPRLRARELLEREPRHLGHDVVEGRLERGRGRARYVVGDLIERVPDRELGRYLRDRKPRRLARERARPTHPRVHLDHVVRITLRIYRKLDVRSSRRYPDLAYYA